MFYNYSITLIFHNFYDFKPDEAAIPHPLLDLITEDYFCNVSRTREDHSVELIR